MKSNMRSKYSLIFIASNLRQLLIFFLLKYKYKDKVFYIFDNNIPKRIKNRFSHVSVRMGKNIFDLVFYKFLYGIMFFIFNVIFRLDGLDVYGSDHIMGAKFFLRRNKFYLIEDGTINYTKKAYIRSWKNKLFSIPTFGVHSNVKEIYLTKPAAEEMPDIVKSKVKVIDINKLWQCLSIEEKGEILSIFDLSKEMINSVHDRKYILFTQPLSEDKVLSEEEKISLYRDIINDYGEENLVIKCHPREVTDYSVVFSNAIIFPEHIPAELLSLLQVDIKKVITLFSTAVYDFPEDKIDFRGTIVHDSLVAKYGIIKLF